MRPNDDNEMFPGQPQGLRPKVRAQWGSFVVQLEVGFGDDIPSRARLKLADEVAT